MRSSSAAVPVMIARVFGDDLDGPVPPSRAQQALDVVLVLGEARADDTHRVARDHRVRRHVVGDDARGCEHGAVADRHARQHERGVAEPDVVTDHRVAAARRRHDDVHRRVPRRPEDAERNVERPGRYGLRPASGSARPRQSRKTARSSAVRARTRTKPPRARTRAGRHSCRSTCTRRLRRSRPARAAAGTLRAAGSESDGGPSDPAPATACGQPERSGDAGAVCAAIDRRGLATLDAG